MLGASEFYPMETASLHPEEFGSLQNVARSFGPCTIPPAHASRLLALGLIYMPLETPCITTAGRSRLANGI
jgi:hypothetical protein